MSLRPSHRRILRALLCSTLSLFSPALSPPGIAGAAPAAPRAANSTIPPATVARIIAARARNVLSLLKAQDGRRLAAYIHPRQGVRFSPYTHVDKRTDRLFTRSQLRTLFARNRPATWGSYDGSGEPIRLTPRAYFQKFVYDGEFLNAKTVRYNQLEHRGNTIDNTTTAYPNSIIIEYYLPGTKKYDGMDWKSLKLVFQPVRGTWYLCGVVHDQWTI